GETGAGKSIMLGALSVLLGNRADTKVVRNRDKKSIVEASFILNNEAEDIKNLLAEIAPDVDWEPESLILRREISPNGRSRSFINDTPVALSTLHDVALRLVDLHSQHQNLLLASPDYQLSIIDTLIPDKAVLDLYMEAYNQYRTDLKAYVKAHKSVEAAKKEEEYLRYQLLKLNEVELEEGIQEELERRRDMLSSVASIKAALQQLSAIFSGDDDSSLINRMTVAEQLIDLTETLPNHEDLARRTASLAIDIKDLAGEFDSAYSSLDVDPEQLEQTEQHLSCSAVIRLQLLSNSLRYAIR
ncbi:MAG: DNA repair protein RecN, partial [Muribaculaceae bacterium]|nr:DNA repair protein RecN [Muribaculaceae bacterium]